MTFSALDSEILGPLFAPAGMAALFSDDAWLAAMLRAETALARSQARLGLAPPALADALEHISPSAFDKLALGRGTALAGVAAIPFVKALQALLPPELEPYVHLGATSQDIVDTALALQLRAALDLLADDVAGILRGLSVMATRHARTPCIARTYGQHAAPITFGFKVAVWLEGIASVAVQTPYWRRTACRAQLGGPVGTLAAMGDKGPPLLSLFAAELNLTTPAIAWHTRRGELVGFGQWLATLAGALAKMAGDIVALSSTEIGEVAEPHMPGRGGSSAMPHKRNPVAATVILANAQAALGQAAGLSGSLIAAHERPAGAWHAEWHMLAGLVGLVGGAAAQARALAEGLVIDAPAMAFNIGLTRGLVFADAAAAALAPGMGRAAAHACVEQAAAQVRDGQGTLLETLRAELPDLSPDILAPAFELTNAIAAAEGWVAPVTRRADALAATLSARAY